MLTVSCSIRFYTECFGMKLLRKRDIPEEKYANAFLGFGPEQSHFVVELTYSMFCSVNLLHSCMLMLWFLCMHSFSCDSLIMCLIELDMT